MASIEIKNEVGVDPKKLSNTTDKVMSRVNVNPKEQTEDNSIENKLNSSMKNFLKTIQNRWIISPNPDIFNRDDQAVKRSIANAKEMIFRFRGAYNLSDFKEVKYVVI
ncbi:15710_t:CDS:2 [Racocetra fulgida]|uniref:15710_t:CDS:1 n=1 Tax=Racocetra fulgida TaxID=60492 RepID=A0A9N8ZJ77_9GLOM|nr:15710_t:CDS:2 [Racocetra fulgida]